ncbi:uncharacterized protein LOC111943434 [Cyanistes caeruleus]|uniref:uncharacterized protein LOC111943434 n=1 Tax=Cyanistes caeruleus TaxID=156563 RepID=UPI000CD9FF43|nr:uncharacterized protein LOC111943434 [Cyanistes caeruleus]
MRFLWGFYGVLEASMRFQKHLWGSRSIYEVPMGFLWGSRSIYEVPMGFLWGSTNIYGVPEASMRFLWGFYGVLEASMRFLWGSYGVPMGFYQHLWGSRSIYGVLTASMRFLWGFYGVLEASTGFQKHSWGSSCIQKLLETPPTARGRRSSPLLVVPPRARPLQPPILSLQHHPEHRVGGPGHGGRHLDGPGADAGAAVALAQGDTVELEVHLGAGVGTPGVPEVLDVSAGFWRFLWGSGCVYGVLEASVRFLWGSYGVLPTSMGFQKHLWGSDSIYEVPMGFLWGSRRFYGVLTASMGFQKHLWGSRSIYGVPMGFLWGSYGVLPTSMGFQKHLWGSDSIYEVPMGFLWGSRSIYGVPEALNGVPAASRSFWRHLQLPEAAAPHLSW